MPLARQNLPRYLTGAMLVLVLGVYLLLQFKNFLPAYSEPDVDAYVWLTKRIATLQPLAIRDDSPFRYQDHMWVQTPAGLITTKFAPGVAVLMAPFYLAFGDTGPYLVPPLAGVLTLVGAFLLFRRWMGRAASLIALTVVALNPLFLTYSGYLLTHAADTCLITWGMLFLFQHLEKPRLQTAIGAGLALGFAVTVRYVNALFMLPVLTVAIITMLRSRPRPTISELYLPGVLLAAFGLFPVALLVYNYLLFSNPLLTGYALSDEQSAFSLAMFTFNYSAYLEGVFRTFLFLSLPLGALGAILLGPWQQRTVRLLWILPLMLLYMAYYWFSPSPSCYRFLLALLPVFVGCAYALIDQVHASRWARYLALGVLAGITLFHDWPAIRPQFQGEAHHRFLPDYQAAVLLAQNLRPNAVLFTDSRFAHFLSQQKQYTLYDLSAFRRYNLRNFPEQHEYTVAQAASGRLSPRRQPSRLEFFRTFYQTESDRNLQQMKRDLIQQAQDRNTQIAFFLPADTVAREERSLGPQWELRPLANIDLSNPRSSARPPSADAWQLLELVPRPPASTSRP